MMYNSVIASNLYYLDSSSFCAKAVKFVTIVSALVYASDVSFFSRVFLFIILIVFASFRLKLCRLFSIIGVSRSRPLHDAVRKNNEVNVKWLLENGSDVNEQDARGITALHIAVKEENFLIVQILLKYGADISIQGKYGNTPLHLACLSGRIDVMTSLLSYGADIDYRNRFGETPLHIAAKCNNQEIIRLLLNRNAHSNTKDCYGETVLHSAVKKSCIGVVEILLEHGADVLAMNSENDTAFDIAVRKREKEITEVLLPHLVLRKSQIESISKIFENLHVENFERDCAIELQFAKKLDVVIDSRITYYDLLTTNLNQIAKFSRMEIFEKVLENESSAAMFPIYISIMRKRLKKALRKKKLLEKCYSSFSCHIKKNLPLICLEEIFDYFSEYELENFGSI
ncbi:hypothetical protein HHI36_017440 [Cryptolaemus montrouzieri]|uniref:Uncharacterized protein n=1 Tax=Cryptolaemus montrouzieri TaxID=559131 RepID=A0ABD2NN18_9CUCU